MAICLSHSGLSMHSGEQAANELYVGTVGGLFLLQRGADGAWSVGRHLLEGSHVCAVSIDAPSNLMVVGTHTDGVGVSTDGGKSWEFRNSGIASTNVFSVAIAKPGGKVRLYAGTEPAHLYYSDDLGLSWHELPALRQVPNLDDWTFPPPPHIAHVKHIEFDPQDPNCIYASVEQGELLRSTDGGASFEDLLSRAGVVKAVAGDAHRVIIRPSNPNELFMPTGFGLYRSSDRGATWTNESAKLPWIGYPDPMVYDPRREEVLFVAGGKENPGHWIGSKNANASVARTTDGGNTWELVSGSLPEGRTASIEAMAIESWPGGCAVYLGTTDGEVFRSEDDGESWERIVDGLPAISKGVHHLLAKGLIGGPPPGVVGGPGVAGGPPPGMGGGRPPGV